MEMTGVPCCVISICELSLVADGTLEFCLLVMGLHMVKLSTACLEGFLAIGAEVHDSAVNESFLCDRFGCLPGRDAFR